MVVLKAILVFIFGPNLQNRILLRPRPKLNNIAYFIIIIQFPYAALCFRCPYLRTTVQSAVQLTDGEVACSIICAIHIWGKLGLWNNIAAGLYSFCG